MTELNIQRGLSIELFPADLNGQVNPRLDKQEGCWYLCTDTAELFLCIRDENDQLDLKRINEIETEVTIDPAVLEAINTEINTIKESLASYAKKTDIPSVEGFATTKFVTDAINELEIPDVSEFIKESDLGDYALKSDIPDITGKADAEHSHEEYAAKEHTHSEYAEAEHTHDEYLTEHQSLADYAKRSEIPSLEGYAKTTDIPSLEGYATKTELFSGSYNDLKDKPEIPSLDGYATEQYVTDAIAEHAAIKAVTTTIIPTVNQTILPAIEKVNTEIVPTVQTLSDTKADKVLFTTAKFVNNPVGSFVANENIMGLSLADLFAKLLGLSDTPSGETPDEPDTPEEFKSLAEKIEKTKQPMYSISQEGELLTVPFKLIDRDAAPTESGFYVVKDSDGNIIDAGYQDIQIENDAMYYIVAFPKELDFNTMVDVQSYDPDESVWVDADIALTSDPDMVAACCDEVGVDISHIDTEHYTVWVQEDICTGSIMRYRIIEEN
jgi:hypothetical protein